MAWVEGEDGLRRGDVVETVPLEEEGACRDVEFWKGVWLGGGTNRSRGWKGAYLG